MLSSPLFAQLEEGRGASYYYSKAEQLTRAGQYHEALVWLKACLDADAFYKHAYLTQGLIHERLSEPEKALISYSLFLELQPDQPEALFSRAAIRYEMELYDLAYEDFTHLLFLPKGETNTLFFELNSEASGVTDVFTTQGKANDYIFNYLGLIELKRKDYPASIQWFDSAIHLNGYSSKYYVNRGLAKEGANHLEGALEDYLRALQIDPEQGLAMHNLGVLLANLGKDREAERYLNEAINQSPDLPYPYAERAYRKMNASNWKGALADYDEAIRLGLDNEENFVNRGLVKERLLDYTGALSDYAQAIQLQHSFEKAWRARANLLYYLDRIEESIEDYSVAIFYDPSYGRAYFNRAAAYHKVQENDKACKDLQKAISLGVEVTEEIKARLCP